MQTAILDGPGEQPPILFGLIRIQNREVGNRAIEATPLAEIGGQLDQVGRTRMRTAERAAAQHGVIVEARLLDLQAETARRVSFRRRT